MGDQAQLLAAASLGVSMTRLSAHPSKGCSFNPGNEQNFNDPPPAKPPKYLEMSWSKCKSRHRNGRKIPFSQKPTPHPGVQLWVVFFTLSSYCCINRKSSFFLVFGQSTDFVTAELISPSEAKRNDAVFRTRGLKIAFKPTNALKNKT